MAEVVAGDLEVAKKATSPLAAMAVPNTRPIAANPAADGVAV
jgi:hypothetical protein